MNIILFEDAGYRDLLPLTWLRGSFELRCGCDRLIDKVRSRWPRIVKFVVREELEAVVRDRFAADEPDPASGWLLLNARTLLTADVEPPQSGCAWFRDGQLVAAGVSAGDAGKLKHADLVGSSPLAARLTGLDHEQL